MEKGKKIWKNYRFTILLLCSILIGTILGIVLKEDAKILKPFGDIFLNLMFTIVVPLVFFTISSSVASMLDLKRLGKLLGVMFLCFFTTSLIAAIIMLVAVKFINPVSGSIALESGVETVQEIGLLDRIVQAITVTDFSELLSRSHMLPLILFSILFGIGVSTLKEEGKKLSEFLALAAKTMMKIVHFIMYYAPIGLCCYFAALIGEFGPNLIGGYAKSFLLYCGVGIFYYLVFYTFYAYLGGGKKGIFEFYKHILSPTATALATQSSLATLPTNLECAEKIGIPKDIREVSLPIGSTMNMHGSVLGSILKIAFLFTVFGRDFSGIGTYVTALCIAVLSGVVMSGIPGGGLIGEMLIVSLYNFPASAFAIIATIGIIIDAPATAFNVVGNPSVTMLVTRIMEGKDWLRKKRITKDTI